MKFYVREIFFLFTFEKKIFLIYRNMSESDKTTITTATTTSTAVTTASSDNVTTPSESYTSSQEGLMKLRLFRNTNTPIDDPETTTSSQPVIDVESIEEESQHPNIAVSPSRKRKIDEKEEEDTSKIKAKKSRPSLLIQQLDAPPLPLSSTTTTTAQNSTTFSHNPIPTTQYRASLGSTPFSQSTTLQQLSTSNNTFVSNPSQPLTSRYLTNPPQTVTTATTRVLNNPQIQTPAAATNSRQIPISTPHLNPPPSHNNISLPQPTGELPSYTSAFMLELRRVGHIQARNAGLTHSEPPYLFHPHQADAMQRLLPLDRNREYLAFRKLMTVQNQIEECQALLSLLLHSGRAFVRNGYTIRRLNDIVSRLTSHLVELKNVSKGIDAVINPHL